MKSFSPLVRARNEIDNTLRTVFTKEHPLGLLLPPLPAEFSSAATVSLAGGKRLRAIGALVGMSASALSPTADSALDDGLAVKNAASLLCALELYQAAALVHDDIVDRAPTRRGLPSAHVGFANHHNVNQWYGGSEHFGTSAAILLGDLLLASADNMVTKCGAATADRFTRMTAEVAIGQYLDLKASQLGLGQEGATTDDALEVIRLKSARYSVAHPVALGATLAGDTNLAAALEYAFEPAGLAFQLRDDALAIWGNESATGKPELGDVAEGKRTVLVLLTMENADERSRRRLKALYSQEQRSPEECMEIAALLAKYGQERHEALIRTLTDSAHQRISRLPLAAGAMRLAEEFVGVLTDRQS